MFRNIKFEWEGFAPKSFPKGPKSNSSINSNILVKTQTSDTQGNTNPMA